MLRARTALLALLVVASACAAEEEKSPARTWTPMDGPISEPERAPSPAPSPAPATSEAPAAEVTSAIVIKGSPHDDLDRRPPPGDPAHDLWIAQLEERARESQEKHGRRRWKRERRVARKTGFEEVHDVVGDLLARCDSFVLEPLREPTFPPETVRELRALWGPSRPPGDGSRERGTLLHRENLDVPEAAELLDELDAMERQLAHDVGCGAISPQQQGAALRAMYPRRVALERYMQDAERRLQDAAPDRAELLAHQQAHGPPPSEAPAAPVPAPGPSPVPFDVHPERQDLPRPGDGPGMLGFRQMQAMLREQHAARVQQEIETERHKIFPIQARIDQLKRDDADGRNDLEIASLTSQIREIEAQIADLEAQHRSLTD